MSRLTRDLGDAVRALRSSAGSSVLVVVVLALGIGASTAVFSVVDAVLFRPLPVHEPARLIRVFGTDAKGGPREYGTAYPRYLAYRDAVPAFSGLAAYRDGVEVNLDRGDEPPQSAQASLVTGNFFEVLAVGTAAGRTLASTDDLREGAHPVALLSHSFWQRWFGGDPAAVGSPLRVNGHAFTIVGVAPRGFDGIGLDRVPDVFLPMAMAGVAEPMMKGQIGFQSNDFFDVVGRLRDGVSAKQAQAQLDTVAARDGAGRPVAEGVEAGWIPPWAHVEPAAEAAGARSAELSRLLLAVVGLVLLIACTDAAAVLLARTERRRQALAVRIAIGASPGRIVRTLLTEGLLLSALAAALGTLLALTLTPSLLAAIPEPVPLSVRTAARVLDLRVLGFTAITATVVGIAFSLLPAVHAARAPLLPALKNERLSFVRSRVPLRSGLVAVQVALSTVLLVGAGLLLRTLRNATAVDPGFDTRGVAVATLDLARGGYTKESAAAFLGPLLERLKALDVRGAALGTRLPLQGAGGATQVRIGERDDVGTAYGMVSEGYVKTLGLTLLRGREVLATDGPGQPRVGIVNETAAETFWPGRDPIGQRIAAFSPEGATIEVVGVVRARAGGPRQTPGPLLLVPLAQFYGAFPWQPRVMTIVRARGDERAAISGLPVAVAALDPHLPVRRLRTAREELAGTLAEERVLAGLLTVFGAFALLLAGVGLYGLVAYSTETRRREFGVRTALGARPRDLARLVLGQGARVTGVGIALGMAIALLASRLLTAYLFGVGRADPAALLGTTALLAAVALLAAAVPAGRAARTDPTTTLRAE